MQHREFIDGADDFTISVSHKPKPIFAMNLSVEISMYPLQDGYKDKIKAFLDDINANAGEVEIRSSNMSTRLFGDYAAVTALLNKAMRSSMQQFGKIVFICKYLEGDARELSGYD